MESKYFKDGERKYEEIPVPLDLEKTLKRTFLKAKKQRGHMVFKGVLGGITAAVFAFIMLVNLSPSFARALSEIPVLRSFAQLAQFDNGFKNVVDNGKIQMVNLTAKDKGARFTVNSVAGDDFRLWISYDFKGDGLRIESIKAKTKDGKDLPWYVQYTPGHTNYLEVITDKLVKDFVLEVQVYKDDEIYDKQRVDLDDAALEVLKKKHEENKVATLAIPISLNSNIYRNDMVKEITLNTEVKTDAGMLKIEKLELTDTRSRVYCRLISDEYELKQFVMPRLVDINGKEYHYAVTYLNYAVDNTIRVELVGGIKDTDGLSFKFNGMDYIKKKDKYITVDLKNQLVEANDLGIEFKKLDSNKLTLNSLKGYVRFNLAGTNEKGEPISIKSIHYSPEGINQVIEFAEPQEEKVILTVEQIEDCTTETMEVKLEN